MTCELTRARVSLMLGIESSSIDVGKSFAFIRTAWTLRRRLDHANGSAKAMTSDVAVFERLGNGSRAALAGLAVEKSKYVEERIWKECGGRSIWQGRAEV